MKVAAGLRGKSGARGAWRGGGDIACAELVSSVSVCIAE